MSENAKAWCVAIPVAGFLLLALLFWAASESVGRLQADLAAAAREQNRLHEALEARAAGPPMSDADCANYYQRFLEAVQLASLPEKSLVPLLRECIETPLSTVNCNLVDYDRNGIVDNDDWLAMLKAAALDWERWRQIVEGRGDPIGFAMSIQRDAEGRRP